MVCPKQRMGSDKHETISDFKELMLNSNNKRHTNKCIIIGNALKYRIVHHTLRIEKGRFSLPSNSHSPRAPQLGAGLDALLSSLCWGFVWLELVQGLCMPPRLLWTCVQLPCCVQKILLLCSHPPSPAFKLFPGPLLQWSLSLGKGRIWYIVPFRAENSTVLVGQLCFSWWPQTQG